MAGFGSLGYARFLREGGGPLDRAEAQRRSALSWSIPAAKPDRQNALDTPALRITVRMGAMLAAECGMITEVIGLLVRLH